ncbi:endonuclease/exonuclease/phosphatase family protein [Alteribacter keqinensis]|uniref:Endonuclease/exonuclease/phosphatase family protein n=1 Tax=Alteribacter keqinensis TaxID=2483800 RepID=A0A3M7TS00_9BACI|nr:endonuclease/exonuclease/phosphatase family protein [Alteribacter keqinensis]RNA68438.1 endonuclease/exonuclease/phosphatase family protein [Alteribacter keqinensis]
MEVKVMSFNLRVDIPQDGKNAWSSRAPVVPDLIMKHQPAVIGTQEGLKRMVEYIAGQLSDYSWIGQGRQGGEKDEFCAIFYNHRMLEVAESGQFWLSETPKKPNSVSWESDYPRICTWAVLRVKSSGSVFAVYNTHLDHISQEARQRGIQLIVKKINEAAVQRNIPFVLTGDFNSQPDNPVIRYLRGEEPLYGETAELVDCFTGMGSEPGTTLHNFEGGSSGKPIDYIFSGKNARVIKTEVDRSSINGIYPSDHYPVISTVEL